MFPRFPKWLPYAVFVLATIGLGAALTGAGVLAYYLGAAVYRGW